MQGKANVIGHAVHVMLLPFPVAFWTGALICDGTGLATRDPFWFRMSVTLLAFGTAGAIATSIPGFIDYFTVTMGRKARATANAHLVWSVAATVVYAAALAARIRRYDSPPGIALSAAGSIALLACAFFGSELVGRYLIGIPQVRKKVPGSEQ
jgi:uncharacterized membrane protein